MTNQMDLSAYATVTITFLSGVILLAVRLVSIILTRITKGEQAPFLAASIDFASYRIRVSRRQRSGATRQGKTKCSDVRVSTSTAETRRKGVSSSNCSTELLSLPLLGLDGTDCASSDDLAFEQWQNGFDGVVRGDKPLT